MLATFDSKNVSFVQGFAGQSEVILADGDDLNRIAAQVEAIQQGGATNAITVELGPKRYKMTGGRAYSLKGVHFRGMPGATEIVTTGTTGAKATVPDLSGYPTTKEVTTSCLGLLLRTDRFPRPQGISFTGCTFLGLPGTPAASGHYYGLGVSGQNISFDRCVFRNDQSDVHDSTALSPYKGLSGRNVLSFADVFVGEDRYIEPDVKRARGSNHVRVSNCQFIGEPLDQTSGTTGRAIGFTFRKCGGVEWSGNWFGEHFPSDDGMADDLVLSGNLVNGDAIYVVDYNPYTKTATYNDYSFITPGSPTKYQVNLGATAAATIANFVSKINANRAGAASTGTDFVEAQSTGDYLATGTDGTLAACRVRQLVSGVGTTSPSNPVGSGNSYPQYFSDGTTLLSTMLVIHTDGGSKMTVRAINRKTIQRGYWLYGVIREDCFGGHFINTDFGADVFVNSGHHDLSTEANGDFVPNYFTESGHYKINNITGELTKFGDALFHMESAGWWYIDGLHLGLAAGTGTNAALVKAQKGNHYSDTITITANPSNNQTYVITDDGHGGTATFTFKTTASASVATEVQIGADGGVTLNALRLAIQKKCDDHTVTAYPRQVYGSGPWTLEVVFWTHTKRSAAVSVTETASNFSRTNTDSPWKPRFCGVAGAPHGLNDGSNFTIPYVWLEDIQQHAYVDLTTHTTWGMTFAGGSHRAVTSLGILTAVSGADELKVTIDSVGTGNAGAAVAFDIINGGGVDTTTTKFIDLAVFTTAATQMAELVRKINLANEADGRSFGAVDLQITSPNPICYIFDGVGGVNASLVTLTTNTGTHGDKTDITTGSATQTLDGYKAHVVLRDVNEATVKIVADGHSYTDAMVMPIFWEKTSGSVTSKLHVLPSSLGLTYSRGRLGKDALVLQGANVVDNDLVVDPSYCDGRRVSDTGLGSLYMNPQFATSALTGVRAIATTTTVAVYMGKAHKNIKAAQVRCNVTTAWGNDGATPWTEVAIAKGIPVSGGNPTLTVVGYTNVAAAFASTGLKTVYIPINTAQSINPGDDLWVLVGNKATTAEVLRAQDMADNIQSCTQAIATTQPSTIVGTPTSFTIEAATILAPWVSLLVP